MKIIYGVLFVLCIALTYSQMTPIRMHISQNQIKDIGSTAKMECTVSNPLDYNVLWTKFDLEKSSDTILFSFGNTLNINDSRFSIIKDSYMDLIRYTLQINDIQQGDSGVYYCQIMIGLHSIISAKVELIVPVPPMIHDNSTSSMVVMEGQQVTLECYATGNPSPKVFWKRENNGIISANRSIYNGNIWKIPAITKYDRGSYTCIAENGFGKASKHRIAIHVEFAPIITVPKRDVGQSLFNNIDISCDVESYPSPAIIWTTNEVQLYDNQVQIVNNKHFRILALVSTDEFTKSTLRVTNILYHFYGYYTCKATNKLGSAEARINLFETLRPVCPPACKKP